MPEEMRPENELEDSLQGPFGGLSPALRAHLLKKIEEQRAGQMSVPSAPAEELNAAEAAGQPPEPVADAVADNQVEPAATENPAVEEPPAEEPAAVVAEPEPAVAEAPVPEQEGVELVVAETIASLNKILDDSEKPIKGKWEELVNFAQGQESIVSQMRENSLGKKVAHTIDQINEIAGTIKTWEELLQLATQPDPAEKAKAEDQMRNKRDTRALRQIFFPLSPDEEDESFKIILNKIDNLKFELFKKMLEDAGYSYIYEIASHRTGDGSAVNSGVPPAPTDNSSWSDGTYIAKTTDYGVRRRDGTVVFPAFVQMYEYSPAVSEDVAEPATGGTVVNSEPRVEQGRNGIRKIDGGYIFKYGSDDLYGEGALEVVPGPESARFSYVYGGRNVYFIEISPIEDEGVPADSENARVNIKFQVEQDIRSEPQEKILTLKQFKAALNNKINRTYNTAWTIS